VLRTFEPNLADVSLHDLDDKMLADPLCWFTIGGPAVILAIAALYFYRKAKRLTKSETKRKMVDRTGLAIPEFLCLEFLSSPGLEFSTQRSSSISNRPEFFLNAEGHWLRSLLWKNSSPWHNAALSPASP